MSLMNEPQPAPAEAREEHRQITEEIEDARWRYFVLDSPTLSDADYDRRLRRLQALEEEFPELRTPDSPTQKVGGAVSTEFTAVDHLRPMESLDNAFSYDELETWYSRLARDGIEQPALLCELKVDGLAINLLYEDGSSDPGADPRRRPHRRGRHPQREDHRLGAAPAEGGEEVPRARPARGAR